MIDRSMRTAYNTVAAQYAAKNAAVPPELCGYGAAFLARLAPAGRVLDVGCGAGRDMAWLETQGAAVIGVDLSEGMLAQARPQVRGPLVQGDMRRLPFAGATFAGLWVAASLLHLPKAAVPAGLREFRRLLRPTGLLFLGLQEGAGEGWERSPYSPVDRFFARYSAAEVSQVLTGSGFRVLQQGCSSTETRTWLQFLAQLDPQTDQLEDQ